ncbi:MAG: nucleoside 2-deoxyribosyltransferase [Desulfatitalea sp.]|nr:nucleoside 2-deoxyribosyltransferase [Desulfatitalea sp.]
MKIYFAGAIRGGRRDAARYQEMIRFLLSVGDVLTEHVGDPELTEAGDDGPDDRSIHDRDMAWLRACDLIVAEVTLPSLGVGYELGWACALGKPVLALYRLQPNKRLSAMIAGSPGIITAEYATAHQAREIMRSFIVSFQKQREIGPGAA